MGAVFRKAVILGAIWTLAAALAATGALAQYPNRAIRLIVPNAAGGAPDLAARVLGEKLAARLGQPIVVENRAGSNGNIGGDLVAKAAADGHTLLLGADSLVAINPHVYARMPFDPLTELLPIATLVANTFFLSVNPAVAVNSFAEFIEYARKADPPLVYGSSGNGSQHHLGTEILKQRAGIEMIHVPYRGGGPAVRAAIAGEVQVVLSGGSSAPQIKAGKLRGLATTGAQREAAFPELPTIAEAYPGYELKIWLGLLGPVGIPEPVLEKLRAEVKNVLLDPDFRAKMTRTGALTVPLVTTPDQFAALIRSDFERYGRIVRQVGIKVD
ncbi:MAG: tripartite tricarboxylate transporter substrate binding protein [Proteobacteria bacterium]|nr:tripartite tricarboxylate transporter substrate binding protein [Pseudomonadota bacterium]